MNLNAVLQYTAILMAIVGALAFLVTVMVEVLKNIDFIKKFPTNLVVMCLSLVLATTTLFVYIGVAGKPFVWYYIPAALATGFFISYVAMFGWDKFNDLWQRFKKDPDV